MVEKPRVMTLAEATTKTDNIVWIEKRDRRCGSDWFGLTGWLYIAQFYEHDADDMCYQYLTLGSELPNTFHYGNPYSYHIDLSIYGKDWRCWTQKPSYEQMDAEKWDE